MNQKPIRRRVTLSACYTGYVTQAVITNLAPLLFVFFISELNVSLGQLSALIIMNFFIQMVVDLASVKFIDKIGYRACSAAACVFAAAGLAGMSLLPLFMPAFPALIAAFALCAVGGGLIEVIVSPAVEALPSKRKAASMSLLHSFYCWGAVAVALLSTAYLALLPAANWRLLPALWAAVPVAGLFLFLFSTLPESGEEEQKGKLKSLLKNKLFYVFAALMLCAGAAEQAVAQWVSYFAVTGLKVSKTVGDLMGPCAFAAAMGITRLLYGLFGAKIKLKTGLLLSGCLSAVGYLTAVFAPMPLVALAGCMLTGFAAGLLWPGTLSLSSGRFPAGGTALFALLALFGDVGCMLGPGLTGFISSAGAGLKTGLLFATIFPLAIIILSAALIISSRKKKRMLSGPTQKEQNTEKL